MMTMKQILKKYKKGEIYGEIYTGLKLNLQKIVHWTKVKFTYLIFLKLNVKIYNRILLKVADMRKVTFLPRSQFQALKISAKVCDSLHYQL